MKALGLERLPAFVFLRVDGQVVDAAEGWNADGVAPGRRGGGRGHGLDAGAVIPAPGDPQAYAGTLALA